MPTGPAGMCFLTMHSSRRLTLVFHATVFLCHGHLSVGEAINKAPLIAALKENITCEVTEETNDVSYTCQNRDVPTCTSELTHQVTKLTSSLKYLKVQLHQTRILATV